MLLFLLSLFTNYQVLYCNHNDKSTDPMDYTVIGPDGTNGTRPKGQKKEGPVDFYEDMKDPALLDYSVTDIWWKAKPGKIQTGQSTHTTFLPTPKDFGKTTTTKSTTTKTTKKASVSTTTPHRRLPLGPDYSSPVYQPPPRVMYDAHPGPQGYDEPAEEYPSFSQGPSPESGYSSTDPRFHNFGPGYPPASQGYNFGSRYSPVSKGPSYDTGYLPPDQGLNYGPGYPPNGQSYNSGSRYPPPAQGYNFGPRYPPPTQGYNSDPRYPPPAQGYNSDPRYPPPAQGYNSDPRYPPPEHGYNSGARFPPPGQEYNSGPRPSPPGQGHHSPQHRYPHPRQEYNIPAYPDEPPPELEHHFPYAGFVTAITGPSSSSVPEHDAPTTHPLPFPGFDTLVPDYDPHYSGHSDQEYPGFSPGPYPSWYETPSVPVMIVHPAPTYPSQRPGYHPTGPPYPSPDPYPFDPRHPPEHTISVITRPSFPFSIPPFSTAKTYMPDHPSYNPRPYNPDMPWTSTLLTFLPTYTLKDITGTTILPHIDMTYSPGSPTFSPGPIYTLYPGVTPPPGMPTWSPPPDPQTYIPTTSTSTLSPDATVASLTATAATTSWWTVYTPYRITTSTAASVRVQNSTPLSKAQAWVYNRYGKKRHQGTAKHPSATGSRVVDIPRPTAPPNQPYYNMMQTLKEGYLVVFLLELTRLAASKDVKDLEAIVRPGGVMIKGLFNISQHPWLGQGVVESSKKLGSFLSKRKIDEVQHYSSMMHRLLRQRRTAWPWDINSIIDNTGALYDHAQGALLFDTIRDFQDYPNIPQTAHQLSAQVIRNVMRPLKRLYHWQRRQPYLDTVNYALMQRFPGKFKDDIKPLETNQEENEEQQIFRSQKRKTKRHHNKRRAHRRHRAEQRSRRQLNIHEIPIKENQALTTKIDYIISPKEITSSNQENGPSKYGPHKKTNMSHVTRTDSVTELLHEDHGDREMLSAFLAEEQHLKSLVTRPKAKLMRQTEEESSYNDEEALLKAKLVEALLGGTDNV